MEKDTYSSLHKISDVIFFLDKSTLYAVKFSNNKRNTPFYST